MRAVEQPARWVASEPQKAAFTDGSVQQNAGDGNMQGSPLWAIRMALRISISGDKLPACGNKFRGY